MSGTTRLNERQEYHYHVIYNNATSPQSKTDDTNLSTDFTTKLVDRLKGWGYDKAYYYDRDSLPGRNIFTELFRVIEASKWTIVILTPGFRTDCWKRYCHQSVFKKLLDKDSTRRLIPLALTLSETDNVIPDELCSQDVLFFNDGWDTGCVREWEKLRMVLRDNVPIHSTSRLQIHEQVYGDNIVRTEGEGHPLVHPSSQTSLESSVTSDSSLQKDGDIMDGGAEGSTGTQSYQNHSTTQSPAHNRETDYVFGSLPAAHPIVVDVSNTQASNTLNATDEAEIKFSLEPDGAQSGSMNQHNVMTIQASPTVQLLQRLPVHKEHVIRPAQGEHTGQPVARIQPVPRKTYNTEDEQQHEGKNDDTSTKVAVNAGSNNDGTGTNITDTTPKDVENTGANIDDPSPKNVVSAGANIADTTSNDVENTGANIDGTSPKDVENTGANIDDTSPKDVQNTGANIDDTSPKDVVNAGGNSDETSLKDVENTGANIADTSPKVVENTEDNKFDTSANPVVNTGDIDDAISPKAIVKSDARNSKTSPKPIVNADNDNDISHKVVVNTEDEHMEYAVHSDVNTVEGNCRTTIETNASSLSDDTDLSYDKVLDSTNEPAATALTKHQENKSLLETNTETVEENTIIEMDKLEKILETHDLNLTSLTDDQSMSSSGYQSMSSPGSAGSPSKVPSINTSKLPNSEAGNKLEHINVVTEESEQNIEGLNEKVSAAGIEPEICSRQGHAKVENEIPVIIEREPVNENETYSKGQNAESMDMRLQEVAEDSSREVEPSVSTEVHIDDACTKDTANLTMSMQPTVNPRKEGILDSTCSTEVKESKSLNSHIQPKENTLKEMEQDMHTPENTNELSDNYEAANPISEMVTTGFDIDSCGDGIKRQNHRAEQAEDWDHTDIHPIGGRCTPEGAEQDPINAHHSLVDSGDNSGMYRFPWLSRLSRWVLSTYQTYDASHVAYK